MRRASYGKLPLVGLVLAGIVGLVVSFRLWPRRVPSSSDRSAPDAAAHAPRSLPMGVGAGALSDASRRRSNPAQTEQSMSTSHSDAGAAVTRRPRAVTDDLDAGAESVDPSRAIAAVRESVAQPGLSGPVALALREKPVLPPRVAPSAATEPKAKADGAMKGGVNDQGSFKTEPGNKASEKTLVTEPSGPKLEASSKGAEKAAASDPSTAKVDTNTKSAATDKTVAGDQTAPKAEPSDKLAQKNDAVDKSTAKADPAQKSADGGVKAGDSIPPQPDSGHTTPDSSAVDKPVPSDGNTGPTDSGSQTNTDSTDAPGEEIIKIGAASMTLDNHAHYRHGGDEIFVFANSSVNAEADLTMPASSISVWAHADKGDQWPILQVLVDGTPMGEVTVTSTQEKKYYLPIYADPGHAVVELKFINDFYDPDTKRDSNIYIHQVKIHTQPSH